MSGTGPGPEVTTLLEMVERRAAEWPDGEAFLFAGESVSYSVLLRRAEELATLLKELGVVTGERVLLVLPNGPEFFFAFYGVLRLGAIAVPIFPGSGPEQIATRAALCGARVVLVPSDLPAARLAAVESALGGSDVRVGSCPLPGALPRIAEPPRVTPDDLAMLQYTSGSTGNPKGVALSHGNLVTNVRQLIAGMEITGDDVFVTWLPVYHDMGLILMTMAPFHVGARLVVLPASLVSVRAWLAAIDEHRGTFTAAPDFAYRLCRRLVRDPASFDLGSLRVALDAAEPVRAGTIEAFEEMFGLVRVVTPAYGLAEATVGVTTWPPGEPVVADSRGLVSVGYPFSGVELKIVENGRELGPGEIGSILIRSPANSRGYWENEAATRKLRREGGFLDSGDLGYVDEAGRLFIAGRRKNIIITAGRNIAPQELEEIVDTLPEVRFSAALGIDRGGVEGEQPYVFAEVRPGGSEADHERLAIDVVRSVHDRLGLRPGRVYILRARSLPRTPNGKIRHQVLKRRYLSGELRREGAILFPGY